jgi:predicted KAP-like P-loop ATPase
MQPLFEQLASQLRELGLRVLVVLDDVDRLQPDELLVLFRAIRLVARFPGVYYLLAYDEQTVIDVLTSTPIAQGRPERALAYLEKIVQVRLDLPPAQRYYTEKMLGDGITDLLDGLNIVLSDEQTARFRELYGTLLQFTLSPPRAVGRFLRQAVAYLPMTEPGELDVIDFLALTHLRSLSPGTYRVVARSKALLTVQAGQPADVTSDIVRRLLDERIREEGIGT